MLLPVPRLIDGLITTLTTAVLPEIATRFGRGQLYAVVEVLANLRDRLEEKASLLDAETASAREALEAIGALLAAPGGTPTGLPGIPATGSPAERADAARAVLVAALDALDDVPPGEAREGRAAIGRHLAANALRDLGLFKPSLLREISKG